MRLGSRLSMQMALHRATPLMCALSLQPCYATNPAAIEHTLQANYFSGWHKAAVKLVESNRDF